MSFGITSELTDSTTLTVDAYHIEVDGRIYRTKVEIENVTHINIYSLLLNAMKSTLYQVK